MSNDQNTPVDFNKILPIVGKVSEYFSGVQNVKNFDDFLALNKRITGSPTLNVEKVGSGAVFGFVAGYSVRHALKFAVLFTGVSFASLQALNHFGYIKTDWKKIEDDARTVFDASVQGGNNSEVNSFVTKATNFITKGLPSTTGFGLGFLVGLKF